jgi:2-iminoacetate synthase ThiH
MNKQQTNKIGSMKPDELVKAEELYREISKFCEQLEKMGFKEVSLKSGETPIVSPPEAAGVYELLVNAVEDYEKLTGVKITSLHKKRQPSPEPYYSKPNGGPQGVL